MALPWVYYEDKFQRIDGLRVEEALNVRNEGCDGVKRLINNVIIPRLALDNAKVLNAAALAYEDDLVIRVGVNVNGEVRDMIFIVSRNPADALFNYYNGNMKEIFNCNYE
ncbi:hypothetical protein [Vulcanisaeta thermophila]|uniref:hypothetical protein n=1 Tax=Vulcanisaeta thermophila TaxID=867917 RepID=UPI0008538598|nr:hypothetical protein [Vulcanisaeta thermophila]